MGAPDTPFWANVRRFRALGLDPLKWVAGCSIELDRESVIEPGLQLVGHELEGLGVTVNATQGAQLIERRGAPPQLHRIVVRPGAHGGAARAPSRGNPNRAIAVIRIFHRRADFPDVFGPFFLDAVRALPDAGPSATRAALDNPLVIGKIHAVATTQEASQLALFEVVDAGMGRPEGSTAVNTETLQITDATAELGDPVHVAAAVTSALNGVFVLGCHEDLALYPLFEAPDDELRGRIAEGYRSFASAQGLALHEQPAIGQGGLVVGATVTGATHSDTPNRHQYVKRGMQVTITRPFGELAPLAAYFSCLADPETLARAEAGGLALGDLERASRVAIETLTHPARAAGEIIAKFRPPYLEPPELSEHLAATLNLAGQGIFAFPEFAARFDIELRLGGLPLSYPDIAAFATSAFLVDNATASAPGAFALVAWPSVLDQVDEQLRKRGVTALRVGEVVSRGQARVAVPSTVRQFVGSNPLLATVAVDEPA